MVDDEHIYAAKSRGTAEYEIPSGTWDITIDFQVKIHHLLLIHN